MIDVQHALHFLRPELLYPFPYFGERQMLLLKPSNQPQSVHMLRAVMRAWPTRLRSRNEALLDVVPDSPRAELGLIAQLRKIERFWVWKDQHSDNVTVVLSTVK